MKKNRIYKYSLIFFIVNRVNRCHNEITCHRYQNIGYRYCEVSAVLFTSLFQVRSCELSFCTQHSAGSEISLPPGEFDTLRHARKPYYITFMATATQKLDNYIMSQSSFMTTTYITKRCVITVYSTDNTLHI